MIANSNTTSQRQTRIPEETSSAPHMFSVSVRENNRGQIIIVGRPTRKGAKSFVNIPVTPELHQRLVGHMVGSLAMGTAALIEWALDELESKGISIEARANA
jgi:hypothetical protein